MKKEKEEKRIIICKKGLKLEGKNWSVNEVISYIYNGEIGLFKFALEHDEMHLCFALLSTMNLLIKKMLEEWEKKTVIHKEEDFKNQLWQKYQGTKEQEQKER